MSDSIFLTDGNGVITGLVDNSYSGDLVIPEYVGEERITSIGGDAFYRCRNLTSVTIPNSVISIGAYAFGDCSGLTSVAIPNSLTSIEEGVFGNCSGLTSVTIPNSVTSIGISAFYGCRSLTSVYVDDPDNLSEAVSSHDWSNTGSSGVTFVLNPRSVEYIIKGGTLMDIGDEIRVLNGTEGELTPLQMIDALTAYNAELESIVLEQNNLITQIANELGSMADLPGRIAELESQLEEANASWAGTLTFSGTYNSSDYYTASGCSLAVDKQKGMAFVTIQGGTSTSYEKIYLAPASLPSGVTMQSYNPYFYGSTGNTKDYYTVGLTGITGKINVAVNFDYVSSTYDYTRAMLTVTYAKPSPSPV